MGPDSKVPPADVVGGKNTAIATIPLDTTVTIVPLLLYDHRFT